MIQQKDGQVGEAHSVLHVQQEHHMWHSAGPMRRVHAFEVVNNRRMGGQQIRFALGPQSSTVGVHRRARELQLPRSWA